MSEDLKEKNRVFGAEGTYVVPGVISCNYCLIQQKLGPSKYLYSFANSRSGFFK